MPFAVLLYDKKDLLRTGGRWSMTREEALTAMEKYSGEYKCYLHEEHLPLAPAQIARPDVIRPAKARPPNTRKKEKQITNQETLL